MLSSWALCWGLALSVTSTGRLPYIGLRIGDTRIWIPFRFFLLSSLSMDKEKGPQDESLIEYKVLDAYDG
jgi:hypothetical protein